MIIEDAKIIANEMTTKEYGVISLAVAKLGAGLKPGQFLQMAVPGRNDLILRRPMSPLRVVREKRGQRIDVLYKLSGEGTVHIGSLAAGGKINLLGPLGRGFSPPPKGREAVLVAGGTGLGPILMLAAQLCRRHKVSFYYGARNAGEIQAREEVEGLPAEVVLCTDDGSLGRKGLVTEALDAALAGRPVLYACGPRPMLKRVQELAAGGGLRAQLSLEERMGCGVGACLSCAVRSVSGGYRMVCKDGPVFKADEIVL